MKYSDQETPKATQCSSHKIVIIKEKCAASGWTLTRDILHSQQMLCQLSYQGSSAGQTKSYYDLVNISKQNSLFLTCIFCVVQASNWVQKSRTFLDSITQRTESVDKSQDAASINKELSAYLSSMLQEQDERVKEVSENFTWIKYQSFTFIVIFSGQIHQCGAAQQCTSRAGSSDRTKYC